MSLPAAQSATPLIALMGNPNTGKTTLFNRLTGSNARVGNYPGITVERTVGRCRLDGKLDVDLLDVPGCYSLTARSPEEQIAVQTLLDGLQLVVVVVDATNLSRNLYLVLQLLELSVPVVVALNMIDELDGSPPDADALSALLAVPVVPISARTREGLDGLQKVIRYGLGHAPSPLMLDYPAAIEADITALTPLLPAVWSGPRARGMALWAMTSIEDGDSLTGVPQALRSAVLTRQSDDSDEAIITTRYAFLDNALPQTVPVARALSHRIDAVLLHPVAGFGVFVLIMLAMFQSLFSWADPMIGLVEGAVGALGRLAVDWLPESLLTDLLVEGVIGGVGNVIVFLPQILLLFFFIGLMEDSGYMARAAYLMDRVMKTLGLQGRAFVPMLSGFACAVPAVMATRTMARQRDRMLTMMVIPLMTCSARLPVYTLLIAALFPPDESRAPVAALIMMALYVFSTVIALAAAWVLGKTVLPGEHEPLLMELPPMRMPTPISTIRLMWQRGRVFLSEAGSVILVCTLVLWALLSFPQIPEPPEGAPESTVATWQAEQLEGSYAGQLGHAIEPIIAPLGFDWKMGVGLIGAFAAREVFVSTMGLVYGVGGEVDEESPPLREKLAAERRPDGTPTYTPLVGISLMVFFALACQCMSTLAVVKRETRGYRWPVFLFVYMTGLAWIFSFVIYQGGRLMGWG
ncbi:MAG: ferrous iron transport protein B [Myxococcota bacterium]|jgi:ferrous iron transport protein B